MIETRPPPLSVVVPTRDTADLTLACLASLCAAAPPGLEVLVIDDASRDGTGERIRERFPEVTILRNDSAAGFTAAANRGLATARGEILLLLNSDTEVGSGGLEALLAAFERSPEAGILGGRLHYPDGKEQWSGGAEPGLVWLFALASALPSVLAAVPGFRRLRPPSGTAGGEVGWVTGAALGLRRRVWEESGPLDERFSFYCQDLDLCLRARDLGWRVEVCSEFRVLHHHGVTLGQIGRGAAIAETVSGFVSPRLLWGDLLLWAKKRRGSAWARRAAMVLRLGAAGRILLRRLRGLSIRGGRRDEWRSQTESLAAAAERLGRKKTL